MPARLDPSLNEFLLFLTFIIALVFIFSLIKLRRELKKIKKEKEQIQSSLHDLAIKEEKVNRLKSDFLSRISHEMRTPLTSILGYSELLLMPDTPFEKYASFARIIHRQGNILLNIIQDLIDLSEIESNTLKIKLSLCSPYSVVDEVISKCQPEAKSKKIKLDVTYQNKIPDQIYTDKKLVHRILFNLVNNAIKYTEAGQVEINVSMIDKNGNSQLHFKVIDEGPGIPDEILEGLFQPFCHYEPSLLKSHRGIGIKLAIAKRLTELLGGTIFYQNNPCGGSIFSFSVDTKQKEETFDPSAISKELLDPNTASPPLLNKKILLVDDNEDAQILISFHLQHAGAIVELAKNGLEGYKMAAKSLKSTPYDIILMDIEMPEMSGIEATQKLREESYKFPILALTAYGTQEEASKCLNAGCNEVIVKPVSRETLINKIISFL